MTQQIISNEYLKKIHAEIMNNSKVYMSFAGVKKELTKENFSDINRLERFISWNLTIERKMNPNVKATFNCR
jgi:hypothetical protein